MHIVIFITNNHEYSSRWHTNNIISLSLMLLKLLTSGSIWGAVQCLVLSLTSLVGTLLIVVDWLLFVLQILWYAKVLLMNLLWWNRIMMYYGLMLCIDVWYMHTDLNFDIVHLESCVCPLSLLPPSKYMDLFFCNESDHKVSIYPHKPWQYHVDLLPYQFQCLTWLWRVCRWYIRTTGFGTRDMSRQCHTKIIESAL